MAATKKSIKSLPKQLQKRLESSDWRERRFALLALSDFDRDLVLPVTQVALADYSDDVRHAAVLLAARHSLHELRDEVLKPRILLSLDPSLRYAAVKCLGEIGDVRDIICLTRILGDADWLVRNEARKVLTQAIARLSLEESATATDSLIHLLFLEDDRIRPLVVKALCVRGRRALPELREALSESSPAMLSGVLRVLGLLADRASLQNLIALCKHEDRRVRFEVAQALGLLGLPEAAAPLVRLLETHQEDVQNAVGKALSRLGAPAIPYLIDAVERSNCPRYRVRCLGLLGSLGADEALPILRGALRSSYFRVRQAAVEGLSKFGPQVLSELKPLLQAQTADYMPMVQQYHQEKSAHGRLRVIRVIGEMGNHAAVDFLKEVRSVARGSKGLKLRRAVNRALFDLGCGAWERVGVLSLVGRLGNGRHLEWLKGDLSHPSYYVRNRAVHAIARLKTPRAARLLADSAVNDPRFFIRRTAMQRFGAMSFDRKLQQKTALVGLVDSAPSVRAEAARILGRLNFSAAVKPLSAGLDDPIWSVREACEIALRNFGNSAARAVSGYLGSEREIVRLRVSRLLGKLGNPAQLQALMRQRRKEGSPKVIKELERAIQTLRRVKAGESCEV
jgi:HEAT repeat protein